MTEEDRGLSSQSLLLDIIERLAIVETQGSSIIRANERAEDSRKDIHEKLNHFAATADTVARIEPIVMRLEGLRQQGIGAVGSMTILGKLLYAMGGLALAILGWLAHALLGTPIRPH